MNKFKVLLKRDRRGASNGPWSIVEKFMADPLSPATAHAGAEQTAKRVSSERGEPYSVVDWWLA